MIIDYQDDMIPRLATTIWLWKLKMVGFSLTKELCVRCVLLAFSFFLFDDATRSALWSFFFIASVLSNHLRSAVSYSARFVLKEKLGFDESRANISCDVRTTQLNQCILLLLPSAVKFRFLEKAQRIKECSIVICNINYKEHGQCIINISGLFF